MPKRKSPPVIARPIVDAQPGLLHRHIPSQAAIRETIESVVIAFVLAFLFRTFEAEAFVIPTGSMAPTLMGRHKDLVCPKCGYPYQAGASEEVDRNENPRGKEWESGWKIASCTCPMCRYTADLDPGNLKSKKDKDFPSYPPSYKGDRILVGKFPYEFQDPRRWDVVVFKFPGDAPTNYIKRLIGLPGETIRIQHGDIWVLSAEEKQRGGEKFQIARKPPDKLLAMLQPVFDNDYMPEIAKCGWPARWTPQAVADASAAGAWRSDDSATFSTDGTAAGENWLRYHHLVPSYGQWQELGSPRFQARDVQPQLIKDFTAYDTSQIGAVSAAAPAPRPDMLGLNWVGDLALECTADVESDAGQLAFELRKGGRRFQCRIDLATGRATLSISGPDRKQFQPTALTNLRGKGRHNLIFSNCDNELLLWVDGSVVSFDGPTAYDDLGNAQPDAADFAPVGVASVGAEVRISRLRVLRDLYYIAVRDRAGNQYISDYESLSFDGYDASDAPIWRHGAQRHVDFLLKADQFFMLGDNSASSQDGRLWGPEYWVSRELLIGKALFIYWPHSWHYIPYINVPFWPNFGRMALVR